MNKIEEDSQEIYQSPNTKEVHSQNININTIEISPKKQYEKVLRSKERLGHQVKDLKNIIKLMRLRQGYEHEFIYNYLKPRHRPRYDWEDHELWSKDGKHYYKINRNTLEIDDEDYSKITGFSGKISMKFLPIDKQLSDKEISRLSELAEKIAGRPPPLMFSDPAEEKQYY